MTQPLPTAPNGLGARLLAGRCSRANLLQIALLLTATGWSAFWAQALGLIHFLPLWAYAAMLYGGLALIPAGTLTKRAPAASPPHKPEAVAGHTPPLGSISHADR